jgi:hypothetical protein
MIIQHIKENQSRYERDERDERDERNDNNVLYPYCKEEKPRNKE